NGREDGCQLGNVYGSYLHGFFDSSDCRKAILPVLAQNKQLTISDQAFDMVAYKESQYDLLASSLRENLDIPEIYRIINKGV
ncbi:MAG: cobyric acid synthase CobQ, partial [Clostridiales bacterium]